MKPAIGVCELLVLVAIRAGDKDTRYAAVQGQAAILIALYRKGLTSHDTAGYAELTEKGKVLLNAMLAVPMPVEVVTPRWEIPHE